MLEGRLAQLKDHWKQQNNSREEVINDQIEAVLAPRSMEDPLGPGHGRRRGPPGERRRGR